MYCDHCNYFTKLTVIEVSAIAKIINTGFTKYKKYPNRIFRTRPQYSVNCPRCLGNMMEVDALMVEIIGILNAIGMTTMYCCSGHYKDGDAYIMFDSNELPKWFSEDKFPFTGASVWVYTHDLDNLCVRIERCYSLYLSQLNSRFEFNKCRASYMKELTEWVHHMVEISMGNRGGDECE